MDYSTVRWSRSWVMELLHSGIPLRARQATLGDNDFVKVNKGILTKASVLLLQGDGHQPRQQSPLTEPKDVGQIYDKEPSRHTRAC